MRKVLCLTELEVLHLGYIYYGAKASLMTELANQRARKALFTCVVYNVMYTPRRRWKGFSELTTTTKPVGILDLKLFYILMQI